MRTNANDAAFPIVVSEATSEAHTGLTKREEFAKAAMQGLCANPAYDSASEEKIVGWSVRVADALIFELNKKELGL